MSKAIDYLRKDPVMAELIAQVGVIRHKPRRLSPFDSLVHAIIHQQLSGTASDAILKRFQERLGEGEFPKPEAILKASPELLREVGLSRPKVVYIHGLAAKALAGEIPTSDQCKTMSDEEIIDKLIPIKGIGRWSVEMLLIFNLGRSDVLPVDDLGVRRGFQISHRKRAMPEPKWLARYGKKWAPYRTMATLYLWQAAAFK